MISLTIKRDVRMGEDGSGRAVFDKRKIHPVAYLYSLGQSQGPSPENERMRCWEWAEQGNYGDAVTEVQKRMIWLKKGHRTAGDVLRAQFFLPASPALFTPLQPL